MNPKEMMDALVRLQQDEYPDDDDWFFNSMVIEQLWNLLADIVDRGEVV